MSRAERAAEVRKIRKGLRLTQQELADGLRLSRGTITRWEAGTVEVTDDKLAHLGLYASEQGVVDTGKP